jgi:hypothetical protein
MGAYIFAISPVIFVLTLKAITYMYDNSSK